MNKDIKLFMKLQLLGGGDPPNEAPDNLDNENLEPSLQELIKSIKDELTQDFNNKIESLANENKELKADNLKFQILNEMKKQNIDIRLYDFIETNTLDGSLNKINSIKDIIKDIELRIRYELIGMSKDSQPKDSIRYAISETKKPPYIL